MSNFKLIRLIFLYSTTMICTLFGSQESRLLDLQLIHSIFSTHYAPKEWKETHLGWDLNAEYLKAQKKVLENPDLSPKEFHRVVRDFLRSAQDYHVDCDFETTENGTLPFSVKSANGRYFVCAIDKNKLDNQLFPINIGDELISLNDEPVDAIAKQILEHVSRGRADFDQAVADFLITERKASEGLDVPTGPVLVKFRDKVTAKPKCYQMIWHYHPEYVTFHRTVGSAPPKKDSLWNIVASKRLLELTSAGKKRLLGEKKSFLPKLGKIVWKNDSQNIFDAYVFETNDGVPVGFLRIPDYISFWDSEEQVKELVEIITQFENSTSQLVIDQTNNPGGSLSYLCTIASLFAKEPLLAPKHKVMMNPSMIADYRKELAQMRVIHSDKFAKSYIDDYSFGVKASLHLVDMLKYGFEFLVSEWDSGKNLSDPIFVEGIDQINPHPEIVYTKPILLLVNELSMSCGDVFPAIMQDSKRALVMGNRTIGAGGAVSRKSLINNDGIARIKFTTSIVERPLTGNPIENLGVTPDLFYKVTEDDLRFEYRDYKAAILETLRIVREQEFFE